VDIMMECRIVSHLSSLSIVFILCLDEYHSACSYYGPWMLTALCGICIVAYQSLLEFLATCGCVHGRKTFQNNCFGTRIKNYVEWFGGRTLSFCTCEFFNLCTLQLLNCFVLFTL
jgi:hypothetical protein